MTYATFSGWEKKMYKYIDRANGAKREQLVDVGRGYSSYFHFNFSVSWNFSKWEVSLGMCGRRPFPFPAAPRTVWTRVINLFYIMDVGFWLQPMPQLPQKVPQDPTFQQMSSKTLLPGGPRASHSLSSGARGVLEHPRTPRSGHIFLGKQSPLWGRSRRPTEFPALPTWKKHRKSSSNPK